MNVPKLQYFTLSGWLYTFYITHMKILKKYVQLEMIIIKDGWNFFHPAVLL